MRRGWRHCGARSRNSASSGAQSVRHTPAASRASGSGDGAAVAAGCTPPPDASAPGLRSWLLAQAQHSGGGIEQPADGRGVGQLIPRSQAWRSSAVSGRTVPSPGRPPRQSASADAPGLARRLVAAEQTERAQAGARAASVRGARAAPRRPRSCRPVAKPGAVPGEDDPVIAIRRELRPPARRRGRRDERPA